MRTEPPPPLTFPTVIACAGCNEQTNAPRWIRRDSLDYAPLCLACLAGLLASFTPEAAIAEASAIVRSAVSNG